MATYVDDVRHGAAASLHSDADGNTKRTGAVNGVTPRTARKWRTPHDSKGSPADKMMTWIDTSEHPEQIVAQAMAAMHTKIRGLTDQQLVEEMRERMELDSVCDANENAARVKRGIKALDRMALHRMGAAQNEWLSFAWLVCAERNLGEKDVFG